VIEIINKLHCGSAFDFEQIVADPNAPNGIKEGWAVVHACKEPYHRKLLGYTGRGAPKDNPEYQLARRDTRLYMNIVDTPDPRFFSEEVFRKALEFIDNQMIVNNVLVHCNEGCSRGPSIVLLYLRRFTSLIHDTDFDTAVEWFKTKYPQYDPAAGIKGFLRANW
jgi:predicted protein tyrosine phosphatase